MIHKAAPIGAAAMAAVLGGCASIYTTEAPGPQRILVRDLETNAPIVGAEVTYQFKSNGPKAKVVRNRRGQIEVQPELAMPDIDQPSLRPMPGDDVARVWSQYNEPAERGPVLNPDGSWNRSNFRDRLIQRTVATGREGYALLPIIHAPIRFRECQFIVVSPGYMSHEQTVGLADLDRLTERGRTIEVYLRSIGPPE